MGRDNISIDDVVKQSKAEVNVLKTQKSTLIVNLKELEEKRDKVSQELLDSEKKLSQVKEEYKVQVETILSSTQDKLAKATLKENEAVGKVANLDQKQKEVEDLISSNKGLSSRLVNGNEIVKANISVLEGLVATIEETLKDIK